MPRYFVLYILALLLLHTKGQSQYSVLQSGQWFKLRVKQPGVYRISRATLSKMGFNVNTDPRKIKIFGYPSGMLPQANSAFRPDGLTELAIKVIGEEDGVFNQHDYIYFYAEGADKIVFDQQRQIFGYEKNLYSEYNFYFITSGTTNGKRITSLPDQDGNFPVVDWFDNFVYHETDLYNELKSGRQWFGEKFDLITELTFNFPVPGILPESNILLVSEVMAQSFTSTAFNLFINNQPVGIHTMGPIPNDRYAVKGQLSRDTFLVPAAALNVAASQQLSLRYVYQKSASTRSIGYLSYFLLQTKQQLRLSGNQLIFRSGTSVQNPVSEFRISNCTPQTEVWNVTDPFNAALQQTTFQAGVITFSAPSSTLQTYTAFNPNAPEPEPEGKVPNQNLRGLPAANLIIITHDDFLSEALRLAAHRQAVSGWGVNVVTTRQVYNEFSGGRQDIIALRDFIKHQYDKTPGTLKAVLLFGKASYDYRNILPNNRNFVPTYQSHNSLHPLLTYSSDDYFGFLENHEGEWSESPAVNHTLDVAVGRLPVKTIIEARQVVDKIIYYETTPSLNRAWRKTIAFVADDGDNNLHALHADLLGQNIEQYYAHADIRKLYLDAFPQTSGAAGQQAPEARAELERLFSDGAFIINYSGHGSERQWAHERLLDELLISSLQNKRLPILVTATCEFGRQDDPVFVSGAELLLLKPAAGAIALVSTSRPVFASNNFFLNEAFYEALFNNPPQYLGEVFRITKNNSLAGVANRNFSLLGDPSLTLLMPPHNIVFTGIYSQSSSDTLRALSQVTIKGEVRNPDGTLNTLFNGKVQLTLFDKPTETSTLGNENPPFTYNEYRTLLFRGQASVENGRFTANFTLPKSINYAIGNGKVTAYAYTAHAWQNAAGYSSDFKVGLSEENYTIDTTPPSINLYVGDTTFTEGSEVPSNTMLIARLYDASGISPSSFGIGNTLSAFLDDDEWVDLTRYYESDPDDYTRGTVRYPLINLAPGMHRVTLKAWDTHNNSSAATITFRVGDGGLIISEFAAYPNPFSGSTRLYFSHNYAGRDLEVQLEILSPLKGLISRQIYQITESPVRTELQEWRPDEQAENLTPGIYLARLVVRSLTNGSKNERVTKLIYLK
ncbi:MAG: peptidase C25 [Cyclobacteriaceae bacterium]|nr:MAG: peptidase C25 [Cyclobacteriaceae bacterium]